MDRKLRIQQKGFERRVADFNNVFKTRANGMYKNVLLLLGAVALILGAIYLGTLLSSNKSASNADERIDAPKPIATQNLNKTFNFPLRDSEGEEVSQIKYVIESANLQDAFIYQGKLARAVKGRTFLIFNLKITNSYTSAVEIESKDYIRISLNNSKELLAPDIHNDPVEIQANSTKFSRIGLPINDTDTDITIFVGELDGKKQEIKLSLTR